MTRRDPFPQYRHWTETGVEFGFVFSILWFVGVALLCWIWPRGGPYQLTDLLWWLPLPFLLPVLPALILTICFWLLVRRRGYATLWTGLTAGLRRAVQSARYSPALDLATATTPALILGQNDAGRLIQLDTPGLDRHLLVVGRTRMGKSTLLAGIAQQDAARRDCAVVVLDPHAGLVEHLLTAGLAAPAGDRLVALLADQDWVPGLNLLQPLPGEDPGTCARRVVESALALWFRGDVTTAQRFQTHAFHAAWALAETGWTVLEVEPLLLHRPFRQQIAAQVADPRLRAWLEQLDRASDSHTQDLAESTVNRFRAFAHGTAALVFGQRQTTFDLLQLLDRRGILLAALPTAALGDVGAYLAAGILLSLIDCGLARRPKNSPTHTNPRVRLLLDEAQAYAVPPLQRLLAERAGFGASVALATQGLSQLADRRWARVVLNNVGVHVVFACSAEEARLMAEEVFRPDPLRVKYRRDPWRTFYSPTEQLACWSKATQHLAPYAFFAHAAGGDPVRAQTRPLPVHLDAAGLAAVRAALAQRVGRPRAEVAAELDQRRRRIYGGQPPAPESADGWF